MDSRLKEFSRKISQISPKAARSFDRVCEEVFLELALEPFQIWFNLGSLISYASSANGIKFFNESPEIIPKINTSPSFPNVLQTAIQLAMEPNSMALDFFRRLPDLINRFSHSSLAGWALQGKLLAGEDYLTGTEYFKAGPSILPVLDHSLLEPWGKIGLLLSREDAQSKSFLTLEYFRTSPDIFAQVRDSSLHPLILKIGHALALQAPKEVPGFFKAVPAVFRNLQHTAGTRLIFSLAVDLSFQAPYATVDFLTNATDLFKMMNGNLTSLKAFVETGLQFKNAPGLVKAFFALQSKKSSEVLRNLTQTVFLSDIGKQLIYYAEMITGRPVEISSGLIPSSRIIKSAGVITLPEKINVYTDRENNFKLYKMMTLHEAAHIEFGTYAPLSEESVRRSLTVLSPDEPVFSPDWEVWRYFPDPAVAQNLWMIAEESRIDYLLRLTYPGAMRELKPILAGQKEKRPNLFNLPEEKAILEALFQLSVHEDIVVPLPIANTVYRIFSILKSLWQPDKTVNDTFHTVCLIYKQLQDKITQTIPDKSRLDILSPDDAISNYGTIPQSPFSHHGLATPDLAFQTDTAPANPSFNLKQTEETTLPESPAERLTLKPQTNEGPPAPESSAGPGLKSFFLYDEWDWMNQDYRPGWCRLVEKSLDVPDSFPSGMDASYGLVLSIRRYFERLRPENLRKAKKEKDGEEFDFDRLVEALMDIRAGVTPSETFYIRREKKERKISAAFLIDLSGSTRQLVKGTDKRIIDIEKESLILMAEALNSVGDEYGLFGFSGQSRNQIEFYTLKGFDEHLPHLLHEKIRSLEPLNQNRDGTVIRHLTRKLFQRESKTKLMIIVSDGKPLDDAYQDIYAMEDTKMALREATNRGIHPFCITVDQRASEYIQKMYREVNYTMISDINTLPYKLPEIYKKLTT